MGATETDDRRREDRRRHDQRSDGQRNDRWRDDRHARRATGLDGTLFVGGGGLIAGVLMGLLMHYRMGIVEIVGGLYALESVTAGWIFHPIHAVLFGARLRGGAALAPVR